MMIKIRVFNTRAFLNIIRQCHSPVYLLRESGEKVNICHNPYLQDELEYEDKPVRLTLEIVNPSDYMQIVLFTTGEV